MPKAVLFLVFSNICSPMVLSYSLSLSLCLWVNPVNLPPSHQQRLNRGVRCPQKPLGWIQMFGVISYCQRGADLFLSSHSSARYVSNPQSVIFLLLFHAILYCAFSFSGQHNREWTDDHMLCWPLCDAHQCCDEPKTRFTPVKSLCSDVCFAASFTHVHCITWCSSASAFYFAFQWQLLQSCTHV